MKLLIFGATGGTGRLLVEQAIAQGHQVTAFVRNPSKLKFKHPALKIFAGNVMDASAVQLAVAGHNVVLSALVRRQIK